MEGSGKCSRKHKRQRRRLKRHYTENSNECQDITIHSKDEDLAHSSISDANVAKCSLEKITTGKTLHVCSLPWKPGLKSTPVQLVEKNTVSKPYHRSILATLNRITDTTQDLLLQRAKALLVPTFSESEQSYANTVGCIVKNLSNNKQGCFCNCELLSNTLENSISEQNLVSFQTHSNENLVYSSVHEIKKDFIHMLIVKSLDEQLFLEIYSSFLYALCKDVDAETDRAQAALERVKRIKCDECEWWWSDRETKSCKISKSVNQNNELNISVLDDKFHRCSYSCLCVAQIRSLLSSSRKTDYNFSEDVTEFSDKTNFDYFGNLTRFADILTNENLFRDAFLCKLTFQEAVYAEFVFQFNRLFNSLRHYHMFDNPAKWDDFEEQFTRKQLVNLLKLMILLYNSGVISIEKIQLVRETLAIQLEMPETLWANSITLPLDGAAQGPVTVYRQAQVPSLTTDDELSKRNEPSNYLKTLERKEKVLNTIKEDDGIIFNDNTCPPRDCKSSDNNFFSNYSGNINSHSADSKLINLDSKQCENAIKQSGDLEDECCKEAQDEKCEKIPLRHDPRQQNSMFVQLTEGAKLGLIRQSVELLTKFLLFSTYLNLVDKNRSDSLANLLISTLPHCDMMRNVLVSNVLEVQARRWLPLGEFSAVQRRG